MKLIDMFDIFACEWIAIKVRNIKELVFVCVRYKFFCAFVGFFV